MALAYKLAITFDKKRRPSEPSLAIPFHKSVINFHIHPTAGLALTQTSKEKISIHNMYIHLLYKKCAYVKTR